MLTVWKLKDIVEFDTYFFSFNLLGFDLVQAESSCVFDKFNKGLNESLLNLVNFEFFDESSESLTEFSTVAYLLYGQVLAHSQNIAKAQSN